MTAPTTSPDTGGEARKPLYGRGYEYTTDPEGLERMRESLLRTPDWHDRAPINCNSLARLLDTIELLTTPRKAEAGSVGWQDIATLPDDISEPFAETNGREYAIRCVPNVMGGLMQSAPPTWGCVVKPTHWMRLPAAPPAVGEGS